MPKISFGIIVLNGQPFLEYNLRGLYPFAHQIIIVEGAVRAAASIATEDGHSIDGTLQMIMKFQRTHDPQNKVVLITAVDEGYADGFWPEKNEMSIAYAKRATGDWLWQVDSDEFYRNSDMKAIISQLGGDPGISAVSFPYREFFGSFDTCITGQWHLYEHRHFHRLFRWGTGYTYVSHRPPTVLDEGGVDLRTKKWISNPKSNGEHIFLYHYSYVFPKQAELKVGYYSYVEWTSAFRNNQRWFDESYLELRRPLFLGERGGLQWLERYDGSHPEAIQALCKDMASGKITEPIRRTDDLDALIDSPVYKIQRALARTFLAIFWPMRSLWKRLRKASMATSP